jgi:acyl-CoA thioester hydrolase
MPESPTHYPVTIEFDIHWGEMDAFGHVNNARHFTWFESCRIAYFLRIGLRANGPSSLGPILAHIGCDYLSPIVYPARLVCGARVSKIGNTSFAMEYALWHSGDPTKLCARGESVIVLMDYEAGHKVPVTDALRRAIDEVERGAAAPK